MNRSSFLAAFVGLLISLSTVADAGVNVFLGSFGTEWHRSDNWSTNLIPNFDDDVLIPTGLTCIISTNSGEAATVEVQTGATLGIEQTWDLTISTPDVPNPPAAMTVDGTVYLKGIAPGVPSLLFLFPLDGDGERLTGSGVITAAIAQGYGHGEITGGFAGCLTIDPGLTLKGTWTTDVPLNNNGTILVDGPDFLLIGSDNPFFRAGICSGTGVFKVAHAQGELQISNVDPVTPPLTGIRFEVSAGLLRVYDPLFLSLLDLEDGQIDVTGGTLLFQRDLSLDDYDTTVSGNGLLEIFVGNLVLTRSGGTSSMTVDQQGLVTIGSLDMTDTTLTVNGGSVDVGD